MCGDRRLKSSVKKKVRELMLGKKQQRDEGEDAEDEASQDQEDSASEEEEAKSASVGSSRCRRRRLKNAKPTPAPSGAILPESYSEMVGAASAISASLEHADMDKTGSDDVDEEEEDWSSNPFGLDAMEAVPSNSGVGQDDDAAHAAAAAVSSTVPTVTTSSSLKQQQQQAPEYEPSWMASLFEPRTIEEMR
ncbi:MAG: hypothetical protein SGARI_003983, partial [Bacillariaceae sp.]